jgi:phage gp46-like protein
MVRIRSSQKFFTEDEVSSITGICLDHLRGAARNKHLGRIARAAEAAGAEAEKWLFSHSDLMILTVLQTRCQH